MLRIVFHVLGAVAVAMASFSCLPPADSAGKAPPRAAGSEGHAAPRAEAVWLGEIGRGREQTARVCTSGARDRVVEALCAPNAPAIRGLADLYRALGFAPPESRYVASTTHSLGLSARIVSAANPRTFVFTRDRAPIPSERLVTTAFGRGEQVVELAALDSKTLDYNFYLLSFEQACNATRCTPEDLLTERIESGWTGFTLYGERHLEDTPLDCLSCHQPFGPGTHKQLVMRQTAHPWLHWGDFRGVYEARICPDPPPNPPGRFMPGDGLDLLVRLEGQGGRHGGIAVSELAEAASGERFSLFLTEAENTIRYSSYPPGYSYAQVDFDSTASLCERLSSGTSATWERQRGESMARGLPVPYYSHDVTDPAKRAELVSDRAGFLTRHAAEDAFDVAMTFIAADVSTAVGFVPRPDDTAEKLLREMCVRCHSASTEVRLKRARFNAERIDRIDPDLADNIMARIRLPRSSPELMPPLRTGELPAFAIARIEAYLREHCSVPGACD